MPAALAARSVASVVSTGWLRISPAGDPDHRAEVAAVGAAAGRIHAEHLHGVAAQVMLGRRHEGGWVERLLPALALAVHRPQLPVAGIGEDARPDQLGLGQRHAHTAAVHLARDAGHRMRAAHDDVFDAVSARVGGEIDCAVELVALHPDQRHQRHHARVGVEQAQVIEVGFHVLVDRVQLDPPAAERGWRHAGEVGQRAVRHEAAPEALDGTVASVLARLDQNDAQRLHELLLATRYQRAVTRVTPQAVCCSFLESAKFSEENPLRITHGFPSAGWRPQPNLFVPMRNATNLESRAPRGTRAPRSGALQVGRHRRLDDRLTLIQPDPAGARAQKSVESV